jgi:Urease accessory protein UreF
MSIHIDIHDLIKLQAWFSPAFPIGAFSYSHGLEWVIETGEVRSERTLMGWIEGVLRHGAGRSDLILVCAMWRAVSSRDWHAAREVSAMTVALQPTQERRLESVGQGTAFICAVADAWPHPVIRSFCESHPSEMALPAAIGLATAAHELPLGPVLATCLYAFAANLVSAGVRLVPLGQTAGLRVLSSLGSAVREISLEAQASGLDELGSAAMLADIASMRHETQYTRLFRS